MSEKQKSIKVNKYLAVAVAGVVLGSTLEAGYDLYKYYTGANEQPIPVESVTEVDSETLDELELDIGTLVYNDTEDTYMVYVDDTEVSPAQDPGWYEIDMNNLVVPEEQQE